MYICYLVDVLCLVLALVGGDTNKSNNVGVRIAICVRCFYPSCFVNGNCSFSGLKKKKKKEKEMNTQTQTIQITKQQQ